MLAGGKYNTICRAALIAWLASAPRLSVAQEADAGGLFAELTFSQRLVDDDQGTFSRTRADFALSSKTAQRSFDLRVGGSYELSLSGDEDDGFDDPIVSLSFSEETRTQSLTFDASFRRQDIETSVLTATDLGFQVIVDEGQVEDIDAVVAYEFGRESVFGGGLTLTYDERNFVDTISPGLIDSTRVSADGRLEFQVHPKARLRVTAFASELDRDGGVDVDTQRYGVGATVDLTQTLLADIDLSFSEVSETGAGADADRDGSTFRLRLVETLQNGTLSGTISSDLTENGRITSLSVGRELQLPRGSLNAELGYTFDDNDNERPTYNVAYSHEFPRGSTTLSAAQSFRSSSAGDELLNSQFSVRHQQKLTDRADFNVRAAYSMSDFFSDLQDDTDQFDFSFSFDQEVTAAWTFTAGYSHTRRSSDSGTESTDDEIFVGLKSIIGWRP